MFDFTSDIDKELDFDLADFDFFGDDENDITDIMLPNIVDDGKPQTKIIKPKIEKDQITHECTFQNAEAFAEQVSLDPNERTFAWVDGSFVFGDVIEALWNKRNVDIKELYICSLSISLENIDSLKNILLYSNIERLVIVLSGYFYSMEKRQLIPYIYQELGRDERVQIAFGSYHCKIFCLETHKGNTITCHGSANLRSSNSIEQIMFEQDKDLYIYNKSIISNIAIKYGTIIHNNNSSGKYKGMIPNKDSYSIIKEADSRWRAGVE